MMASIRANTSLFHAIGVLLFLTTNSLHADRLSDLKTRSILPDIVQLDTANAVVTANEAAVGDAQVHYADDRIVAHVLAATLDILGTIGAPCGADLNRTVAAIGRREAWAIAMFDASVKLPSGIEHGNVYQFGNFDECMAIGGSHLLNGHQLHQSHPQQVIGDGETPMVRPMYCLAEVQASDYMVRIGANRHFQLHNHTAVQWGVCLPATCTDRDAERLLAAWTGYADVRVPEARCHRHVVQTYSALDVLVSCVIMAMLSMVIFCSGFHAVMWATDSARKRCSARRGVIEQVIMSFSLIENMQKLGQASRDELGLSAINGIKAISMIFIIAGHALLFMVGGPQLNADFYAREIQLVQNAFIVNSPLLVDTFLLLSGFLFAHLLLVELEKRAGRINFALLYLFRYVRLTPAYLAVIALYATWLPKLGSGPLWDERMGVEQERCRASWWLNVLYVNNYVGTEQICMFQSWYLAADTQLFVLAPLVVYPLWRWRRLGLVSLIVMSVISVLVPLVSTLVYDTDPSLLPYADEVEDITTNRYFVDWYIKTHMRATSYLIGILAGFLVHYVKENDIKLSATVQSLLWLTASSAGIASMFSIVAFFGVEHSATARALYAGLHRLGWSYSTGWIVVACACGYAGPLRALLSARALVPLSRLTYSAYLMNGLVELYQAASVRTPKYMSTINMLVETISHILLTFIGALVLCLLFESPIHGLEKIFLRRTTVGGSGPHGDHHHHHHHQKAERRSDSSLGPSTESDSTT